MAKNTKYIGAGLIALLILGIIWAINNRPGPTTVITTPDGQTHVVGAVASPDIPSPYLTFGGVTRWAGGESLIQATSTVCAIQAPAATSSLVMATVNFSVASTAATTITLAKATTAFATTTDLGTRDLAAGAQVTFTITATTTTGASVGDIDDTATTFAPNTWFNVGLKGGTQGANSAANLVGLVPTGSCKATWQSVP